MQKTVFGLIICFVCVAFACLAPEDQPALTGTTPRAMTSGARAFSRKSVDSSRLFAYLTGVKLPLRGTAGNECSSVNLTVTVRKSLDSDLITMSPTITQLLCPQTVQWIAFSLGAPFLLNTFDTYYIVLTATDSVTWDAVDGTDASYALSGIAPINLTQTLLVAFTGACSENKLCYDDYLQVANTQGTTCRMALACAQAAVCTGDSVGCPSSVNIADGTPCEGGFCDGGVCGTTTNCTYESRVFTHGAVWNDMASCKQCTCFVGNYTCNALSSPCTPASPDNTGLVVAVIVLAIVVIICFVLGVLIGSLCRPKPMVKRTLKGVSEGKAAEKKTASTTTTVAIPSDLNSENAPKSHAKVASVGGKDEEAYEMEKPKSKPKPKASRHKDTSTSSASDDDDSDDSDRSDSTTDSDEESAKKPRRKRHHDTSSS